MEISNKNWVYIIGIVIITALLRLLPHPTNFAPLAGMAIFSSYYLRQSKMAIVLAATAWWLSDLVLNNTIYSSYFQGFTWFSSTYYLSVVSIILISLVAQVLLKNFSYSRLFISSLASSIIFFLVTNFGSFIEMYPHTLQGLGMAFTAGLPFFKNTVLGDLFYVALFFGVYSFIPKTVGKEAL